MNRREFIQLAALGGMAGTAAGCTGIPSAGTAAHSSSIPPPAPDILPGQWRPYFPFEQIAWIRTPWSNVLFPEYIWLDYPEAIFTRKGLMYLSHINPQIPSQYPHLKKVPWNCTETELSFERKLPNGVRFGGSLFLLDKNTVEMKLFIDNQGKEPLEEITLQTCAYLRCATEFSGSTQENKFVRQKSR